MGGCISKTKKAKITYALGSAINLCGSALGTPLTRLPFPFDNKGKELTLKTGAAPKLGGEGDQKKIFFIIFGKNYNFSLD